jgi:hypothetical protein
VVIVSLTLFLIGTLGYIGLFEIKVLAVLLASVGGAAILVRAWDRKHRAAAALVMTAAIFLVMPGVSRLAKAETRRALAALDAGEPIDVVADVNPGVPWCWGVLTLQKATDQPTEALVARRATLSLLPSVWPASACASARLSSRWSIDPVVSNTIVWHRRWRINVEELRTLAADNCRVRAWLQFGRVPYVSNGSIADLRFEHPLGQNFTPMAIHSDSPGCPPYLTDWDAPRIDVLELPPDRP